jgi:phosphoglycerate dehydrogenase-like enzyme
VRILVSIASRIPAFTLPPAQVDRLRAWFPEHTFVHAATPEAALAGIRDAEVVFTTHLSSRYVDAAPLLRWVHSPAAGVNALLVPELLDRPIVVTNSRGLSADTIAEHALALLFALFRRLPDAVRAQGERRWVQDVMAAAGHRQVAGSRVLVVGLGAIGSAAATKLMALGARVSAIRRQPGHGAPPGVERVGGPGDLHRLLTDADVVLVAAPETDATRHLIDAPALACLPAGAVLVNVSRGGLVDQPALVDALESGRLGGAALDVFEEEPLPAASPLWRHPGVLITPHVAGFLPRHWDHVTALFADNLRRFVRSAPLRNVVDKRAGY